MKNKKNFSLLTIICMCIIFIGVAFFLEQNDNKNPPKVIVKVNDNVIDAEIGINQWNGVKYDREDTFKAIMNKKADLVYVQLGKTISIEFKDNPPDKFTVYDQLLDEKGENKYSDKVTETVSLSWKDGKYWFDLKPHVTSALSSNFQDYDTGNTIRGFRIVSNWGENECEYAFIIRTDAIGTQVDNEAVTQEDVEVFHTILPEGNNLVTRIIPPKDYIRIDEDNNSFVAYMRNLPLKEDGSPVLLYNGDKKGNQMAQVAIFDMDIGEKDLQQCADSIMRMYAEYYWSNKEYERIAFHLTNNFLMEYLKWRDGYRLKVSGNNTSWIKTSTHNDSYESFRSYLDTVFIYAGTLSLDSESEKIELSDIQVGDMFIEAGSPGHCVLVVDIAENETGNKAFLLAQGYMPAQEFHVLKNPLHEEDPWYYSNEIDYPLKTPQWTFGEGSLKRWMD